MTKPFAGDAVLCLLGRPGILADGERRPLEIRPKAVALLARVALSPTPVARRQLAAELFPDLEDPLAQVRWHLSHLRSQLPAALGTAIRADRDNIAFDGRCDASAFIAQAEAVAADPGRTDAYEILAAYAGDLCDGLAVSASPLFENWLYVQQELLRRRFRAAVVTFARWAAAHGRAGDSIETLARLVSVDPYFEDGHALLIEAYAAMGEVERARVAYQRYERLLRDELHAAPRATLAAAYSDNAHPAPERTLPLDDLIPLAEITMHVVEWPGAGPTILAIHGSIGSGYSFSVLADQLTPEFRMVAPDLRGHGFSDKPPSGYDLDRHLADLDDLWDTLALDRPLVLGFSAGGAIATLLAATHDCRGLVLLDGVVADPAITERAAAQVVGPLGDTLDLRFASFDAYTSQWRRARPVFNDDAERLSARVTRFQLARLPDGTYRRRPLRIALNDEWDSIVKADALAALRRVRCPTLVVQATKPWIDGVPYLSDIAIAEQMDAARTPTLVIAPRSDHPALINDPEKEMIDALAVFGRSLR